MRQIPDQQDVFAPGQVMLIKPDFHCGKKTLLPLKIDDGLRCFRIALFEHPDRLDCILCSPIATGTWKAGIAPHSNLPAKYLVGRGSHRRPWFPSPGFSSSNRRWKRLRCRRLPRHNWRWRSLPHRCACGKNTHCQDADLRSYCFPPDQAACC